MNEDFVTYEQAVKFKELGFDWECNHFYYEKTKEFTENYNAYSPEAPDDDCSAYEDLNGYNGYVSAPTLAQVQKWLYEKFGWWLIPIMAKENKFIFDITDKYAEPIEQPFETFDTPFIALSAGIDKALELLKEQ